MRQRRGAYLRRCALLAVAMALSVPALYLSGRYAHLRILSPDYAGAALTAVEARQAARSGEVLLIDIRTPGEWRNSGLPAGAHPLDMRRPDFARALSELAGGDLDAPIALICARGVRSARLGARLSAAGFSNIFDVPEGMWGSHAGPGWLARGLPVIAYEEKAG